ncbi:MAG: ATP-binding protein [Bacteroidales bacterium]|nr:ATP-binding protein [Bacteroidales bacterium]
MLTLLNICANAQSARVYSSSNGLPNSQINHIYQDKDGFIWASTENGLYRFNGTNFTTFRHDLSDKSSISSNLVLATLEDEDGYFWIGTSTGLNIYDKRDNTFSNFILKNHPDDESGKHVSAFLEVQGNSGKEIWIGTSQQGLFILNQKTHEQLDDKRNAINQVLPSPYISKMFQDSDGRIWIASEVGGLAVVSARKPESIDVWKGQEELSRSVVVTAFAEDKTTGNIILGTSNSGLLIYDADLGRIKKSKDPAAASIKIMSLLKNTIIQKGVPENSFLVGTENLGLKYYDVVSDRIIDFDSSKLPVYSGNWKVHCLEEDIEGNVWIGAYNSGLAVIPKSVYGFQHEYLNRSGIPTDNIASSSAILKYSKTGDIWVGTDGGGIFTIDASGKKSSIHAENSGLSNDSVTALKEDKHGNIWIGTYLGGVQIYKNGIITDFVGNAEIGTERIATLYYDKENDLMYIGTFGYGFFIYSIEKGKFIYSTEDEALKWVTTVMIDKWKHVWLGTTSGPIIMNPSTLELTNFNDRFGIHPRVYSFCEGKDGQIWIGTGQGLYKFTPATESVAEFSEKDGLSSDVIKCILEADNGDMWVSTSNGLNQINHLDLSITQYYASDGLEDNEFHSEAALKDSDGTLHFGGIRGLSFFNPADITGHDHLLPKVFLTNLKVGNTPYYYDPEDGAGILDKDILEASMLTLPYDKNSFSIEFSAPEYTNPSKMVYCYRLEGFSDEWTYTDASNQEIIYTNVPYGKYKLVVKAYFACNDQAVSQKSLSVKIMAPWYLSWVAFVFYILLLTEIILILRRSQKRKVELEKETHEARIKELKLQMFTNLSHEIKTPLSLVMAPLKKMRETEKDPSQKDLYNLMYRNCLRVVRIVNQLLDMRKIDEGKLELHFLETEILYFVKDIVQSFENLAFSRKISLTLTPKYSEMKLWIDQGNFDKIIFNILSNAFKHTRDEGSVEVRISDPIRNNGLLDSNISRYVTIEIENSGSHIDEQNLDKVFDRFFQTDVLDAKVGSGVGLNLAKMLVDMHHGKIKANNTEKGVVFSIYMPVGNVHLSEMEMSPTTHHKDLYTRSLVEDNEPGTTADNQVSTKDSSGVCFGTKRTIVIVDDDDDFRAFLKSELKGRFNIEDRKTPGEAWAFLKTSSADIVITDLATNFINGEDLCKRIKGNSEMKDIPIIVLSGISDSTRIEVCRENGAADILSKPVTISKLSYSIERAIGSAGN